jgi:hypothetical protein
LLYEAIVVFEAKAAEQCVVLVVVFTDGDVSKANYMVMPLRCTESNV